MIKLQDMTPDVYYNQSRDFQFIGRLYDIVLNSVKTNVDLIQACPISDNTDNKLIDLMAFTLGFKSKHNYSIKQLQALCTTFMKILKKKGSIEAIELALTTLFQAENVDQEFAYDLSDDNTLLTLYIPGTLTDINLFKDLLTYILPAGMSVNIIRTFLVEKTDATLIGAQDTMIVHTQGKYGYLYQSGETGNIPTLGNKNIYSNASLFQEESEASEEEPKQIYPNTTNQGD